MRLHLLSGKRTVVTLVFRVRTVYWFGLNGLTGLNPSNGILISLLGKALSLIYCDPAFLKMINLP